MGVEIDTRAPKRSYASAFNPLKQTPQQNNYNNQMMMDCSNSLALVVVPPKKLGAKPKKQRCTGAIPPKKLIAKPKPKPKTKPKPKPKPRKSSGKPKKQGHGGCGRKAAPIKQTYDEAGCGSSADKAMLWKLLGFLENDMKYKDITDVKIISEIKLTDSDVKVRQGRLAFSRQQIRTPFLPNSEIEYRKNHAVPVKVIVGLNEYELVLTRWNYAENKTSNNDKNKDNSNNNNDNNNSNRSNADNSSNNNDNSNSNNADNSNNNNDNNNSNSNNADNSNNNDNSNSNNADNSSNNNDNNEEKQTGWKYVIRKGWNKLRKQNNLQEGDWIQLVSFWSENLLHIVIVKYEYIVLAKQKVGEYVVLRS